jgi:hypothetical protein
MPEGGPLLREARVAAMRPARVGDASIAPIAGAGRLLRHESHRRDQAGVAIAAHCPISSEAAVVISLRHERVATRQAFPAGIGYGAARRSSFGA